MDLVVEGANFYPRILEDMERAESSIHVVQFGFRPGKVGDRLADVLARKARAGVAVRISVDANGSATGSASRPMFQRLVAAGADVVVNHGVQLVARQGPIGAQGRLRLNLRGIGHIDHRKLVVVDGRTGWVGAGFEDHFWNGEFHDLFLRLGGAVVSQLQLVAVTSSAITACASATSQHSSQTMGRPRRKPSRPWSSTTRPAPCGRSRTPSPS